MNKIRVERQKIYDEDEDLNDLISDVCPVESKDDPVWEKGARSIIMAVCLAMLEDSEFPELEMTREKFCFYNINRAIGNSDNNFEDLRNYFKGRDPLSRRWGFQAGFVRGGEHLASYMSIALISFPCLTTRAVRSDLGHGHRSYGVCRGTHGAVSEDSG